VSLQSLFARPASLPVVPKVVGYHHGEVSAELALCWSFPSAQLTEGLESMLA
jgi:hypothetical protein